MTKDGRKEGGKKNKNSKKGGGDFHPLSLLSVEKEKKKTGKNLSRLRWFTSKKRWRQTNEVLHTKNEEEKKYKKRAGG